MMDINTGRAPPPARVESRLMSTLAPIWRSAGNDLGSSKKTKTPKKHPKKTFTVYHAGLARADIQLEWTAFQTLKLTQTHSNILFFVVFGITAPGAHVHVAARRRRLRRDIHVAARRRRLRRDVHVPGGLGRCNIHVAAGWC